MTTTTTRPASTEVRKGNPWMPTFHGVALVTKPLGGGFLDLPKIVGLLRRAVPRVRFNLEMMTRDPLKVPCLKDKYWATFETVPGRDLARAMTLVRANVPKQPLPVVTGLSTDEKLRREDDNVRACFAHAREKLGL